MTKVTVSGGNDGRDVHHDREDEKRIVERILDALRKLIGSSGHGSPAWPLQKGYKHPGDK